MISHVYGGDQYLTVTSNKGATPYINNHTNQPMIGTLTYDANSQSIKVFDGVNWQIVGGGHAMVNLSPCAIEIMKWAEKKMFEEKELQALCEKSSAIKDIVGDMRTSMDNYINKIEMIKTLIKEEEKIVTS